MYLLTIFWKEPIVKVMSESDSLPYGGEFCCSETDFLSFAKFYRELLKNIDFCENFCYNKNKYV